MDKAAQIENSCILIKNELAILENKLKEIINEDENYLLCDLNIFLFNNPKRLRPRFIFLFSKLFESSNTSLDSKLVQEIACITELIHNASLMHDDIIDNEQTRRGNLTFYKKHGSKIAVLEGDYLLSLALDRISYTNIEIMRIFSRRIKKTIQGEISQNEKLNNIPTIDQYLNKTYNKTANLFLAPLEALFSIKTSNYSNNFLKKQLYNYMENYSLAFQIKNDIDNFQTNYSDIKNGNYTLPMIYLDSDNKSIDSIEFNKLKDQYSTKALNKVIEYQNKALDYLEELKKDITIEKQEIINSLIELTKITLRS